MLISSTKPIDRKRLRIRGKKSKSYTNDKNKFQYEQKNVVTVKLSKVSFQPKACFPQKDVYC